MIRGKGSVKEGKFGRRDGPLPGENEPLHAYVTSNDSQAIKRAVERVRFCILTVWMNALIEWRSASSLPGTLLLASRGMLLASQRSAPC